ncbi:MAG: hypothetical protein IJD79_02120 [Clostridia bacterium]|nr:hypothetical protein [Clostridia bacterium]
MNFTPFDVSRQNIDRQYERYSAAANKERSEELYKKIRAAFDTEEYAVLGKAKANEVYLDGTELFINPYDIFADLCDSDVMSTPIRIRKEIYSSFHKKSGEARRLSNIGAIFANGDYSHTMPDWEKLLEVGLTGIITEAGERLSRCEAGTPEAAFYEAVKITYEATARFALRLASALESTEGANAAFAKENLKAIASRAPKTLAEAMQLYFIYYFVQQKVDGAALRSLGEIDVLLYPFYKSDLERGVSEGEIRELFRYFLFKWNSMRVEANIPFDIAAEPNELTYLILDEYTALDVHDPKIHVKVSGKTPERLIKTVFRSIRDGKNSFVFINDKVIKEALVGIGIDPADAENYTLIGCYEPSAVGKELPCTVNGKLSLPHAISFVMQDIKSGKIKAPETFEDFSAAVFANIDHMAEVAITEINTIEKKYPRFMCAPSMSGTYRDAMERGVDVYSGGAKYNNSSICAYGVATFVDSMLAVRRAVYEEKLISLTSFADVLASNWQGESALRQKILRFPEKYGRGNIEADKYAKDLVDYLSETINGRENGRGGVYRLGLFSIDWIFKSSKTLDATPDGRLFGEPVSKNLCSVPGMDKNGVTGLMRSAMAEDHTKIPNGAVLDVALHPTSVSGDEGLSVMHSLLNTYFMGGGFAIQFNVVSPETLIAAQNDPEKYKNLQVRLCGWNVYFCDLEREVQDNLIAGMKNV